MASRFRTVVQQRRRRQARKGAGKLPTLGIGLGVACTLLGSAAVATPLLLAAAAYRALSS